MSQAPNFLFPLVLDNLRRKPLLFDTQNNLLNDLNEKLKSDGIKVHNLKKNFESILTLGKGLGILTVQNESVRMPFHLNLDKRIEWKRSVDDGTVTAGFSKSRSKSMPGTSQSILERSKHQTGKRIRSRSPITRLSKRSTENKKGGLWSR